MFLAPLLLLLTVESPADLRSREVLRHECASASGRRELTVFGNGTVRLRIGPVGREEMLLAEMGIEGVKRLESVLAEIDLAEAPVIALAPSGAAVERCILELQLQGIQKKFQYSTLGAVDVAVGAVLARVEDLYQLVREASTKMGLPKGYRPKAGDRLEHQQGGVFEVQGLTTDGKGVELVGVDQPVVLYVSLRDLSQVFRRLVNPREEKKP